MSKDNKLVNVPALSAEELIEKLSYTYERLLSAGLDGRDVPAVMLWGQPGIGKSAAVKQIARELGRRTGKRCDVTDVRLLLFNPIDLRGIPTANQDKTLAVWLKPKLFAMDESSKVINILFLDEISAAPPSVQAAAYQITLDRTVGEHKLPDNCIVIAAGNRVTDKSVAYKMPKALANRMCHMEIKGSFTAWQDWAIRSDISARVLGFLAFRQDQLNTFDPANEDLAFATPRSWEMVSRVLKATGDNPKELKPVISGLIGTGLCHEFVAWCSIYDKLPKIEDIFSGKERNVPTGTDVLYALISSMTVYAREHKDDSRKIAASIRYAMAMPPDFAGVLLRNYLAIDRDYKSFLMSIPEFYQFIRTKGKHLNGNI